MPDDEHPPIDVPPLSPRQLRFVEEYLTDRNATGAYVRAGYRGTRRTARSGGHFLLKNPLVAAAVKQAEQEILERVRLRQHEIYMELRNVVTSNIDSYVVDDEGNVTLKEGVDESAMRAISSIQKKTTHRTRGDEEETTHDVKITLWNKVDSIRIAAQAQGMLVDKQEQTGAGGGPVIIKVEYGDKNS